MKRLHVFPDAEPFGRRLSRAAGLGMTRIRLHRFPDGESLVRVGLPVGSHAVVLRSLHDPDAKLVETLLAADALRRAGARRITLVTPYMPYMRQDAVFRAGEPLSQRAIGSWLGSAYDELITVEAHLHRIRRLGQIFPGRARSLAAAPVLAGWLKRGSRRTLLVGPDQESEAWVRSLARSAGLSWVVGSKQRLGDERVRLRLPDFPTPSRAVIVDDIASSGATIAAAARALRSAGVARVEALVVHAIFAPRALGRIRRAGVGRVVSSDSIPHATNGPSTVPILARALGPGAR